MDATNPQSALLVIDMQRDFIEQGIDFYKPALPVPGSLAALDWMNTYTRKAGMHGMTVFASKCWHPERTAHFKRFPPHCVAGTPGAEFHPSLYLPFNTTVILKGIGNGDDFSVFDGFVNKTPFGDYLVEGRVKQLYVGGVATDICVIASVLEALHRQIQVTLLTAAMAGLDPEQVNVAMVKMTHAGALKES